MCDEWKTNWHKLCYHANKYTNQILHIVQMMIYPDFTHFLRGRYTWLRDVPQFDARSVVRSAQVFKCRFGFSDSEVREHIIDPTFHRTKRQKSLLDYAAATPNRPLNLQRASDFGRLSAKSTHNESNT